MIDTAGPGAAVAYHAFLEQSDRRLDGLPNAERFLELATAVPERTRHLDLHTGHLTELNPIDRQGRRGSARPDLGEPTSETALPRR